LTLVPVTGRERPLLGEPEQVHEHPRKPSPALFRRAYAQLKERETHEP
jgi:hypothetical protein